MSFKGALADSVSRARVASAAVALVLGWLSLAGYAETPPRVAKPATVTPVDDSAATLYARHCAVCHGATRLGGTGPALLPDNLGRVRRKQAARSIAEGLPATQMPAFGDVLTERDIEALVALVYTPLESLPKWGMAEIRASRVEHQPPRILPSGQPAHDADPLNLFLVVELGDHHATVLDGDRLEPIHRFKTRYALHGGLKYSPDGRFVYLASRDGWVSKFDLNSLQTEFEVRAGINTRNVAVSGDGSFLLVGNYLPHTLVVLDARTLEPIKIIDVVDDSGQSSRISAVYAAPPRHSFVAALKDIPEVWEIPYSDRALPVYRGVMHDYRAESGEDSLIDTSAFPVRRIKLDDYLDDFFFDASYRHLIGASRAGGGQVVNLDVGRAIASLDLPGMPHLGSGITWQRDGRTILVTPNLKEGRLSIIDMTRWEVTGHIETLGPGFFLRSHGNSRYAWTDVFFGPHRDAMHVIDKQSLEVVATLRPEPGKTAAHVEFDRYGRYALVSVWDMDGAVVVYDAETLEEIKRIPMRKPSGKYNVYNKIHYEAGTSH